MTEYAFFIIATQPHLAKGGWVGFKTIRSNHLFLKGDSETRENGNHLLREAKAASFGRGCLLNELPWTMDMSVAER